MNHKVSILSRVWCMPWVKNNRERQQWNCCDQRKTKITSPCGLYRRGNPVRKILGSLGSWWQAAKNHLNRFQVIDQGLAIIALMDMLSNSLHFQARHFAVNVGGQLGLNGVTGHRRASRKIQALSSTNSFGVGRDHGGFEIAPCQLMSP